MNKRLLLIIFILIQMNFGFSQKNDSLSLNRLETFSEIYSNIRYYYPLKMSAKNWDLFLIESIHKIEQVDNDLDFEVILYSIFKVVSPELIISLDEINKSNKKKYCWKAKQVFWQYKGFTESSHGQYESRLINVDPLPKGIGLSNWLEDLGHLENSQIIFTAQARTDKPKKNKLKMSISGFEMKTKSDSVQSITHNLTKKWNNIQWVTNWNQDESYLSFLFELIGSSYIELKDINFEIKLKDTVFNHSINLNNNSVIEIPSTAINYPFGYEYSINKEDKVLKIKSIDSINNKMIFSDSPAPNEWFNSKTRTNIHYAFPVSVNHSDYIRNKKNIAFPNTDYDNVIENKFAAVIKIYSVIKTFYPYKKQIGLEPIIYLTKYLNMVNEAYTGQEIYKTLRIMVAELNDGHALINHEMVYRSRCLNADFKLSENKVMVSGSGTPELEVGDEIIQIDHQPIQDLLTERKKTRSGSEQWKTYMETMLIGCKEEPVSSNLIYIRQEDTLTCNLERSSYALSNTTENYPSIKKFENNIFYVDLCRLSYNDFFTDIEKYRTASGIVFDLRGYPKISPEILSHLTTKNLYSAKWQTPLVIANNLEVKYDTSGIWTIPPLEPNIQGEIVFLINTEVISYGESLLGIIDNYNLGTTIGSKSAGANGNKTQFSTPGGFTVYFTGMMVNQHNGNLLLGQGIEPNIHWEVNSNDIENETELIVDYAVSIINKNLQQR